MTDHELIAQLKRLEKMTGETHYTVHYKYKTVYGWTAVFARSSKEARKKHKARWPQDKITDIHVGPVEFVFKII